MSPCDNLVIGSADGASDPAIAMQQEKARAYSSRRALGTLSRLSRSLARAESRDELLEHGDFGFAAEQPCLRYH